MKDRQLSVFEKKFLLCAEKGDVVTVKKIIEDHGKSKSNKFDINCTDPLGRTALVLAIENENMELITMLLESPNIKPGDALLIAIHEEYVEAVEALLQYEERVHKPGEPYSWENINHDISTYTKDITPLILAAHKDNYEILKLLLDRGATLPLPHDVKCGCTECVTSTTEDCLKYSRSRINAYRALCSPSLIALSSRDPILTAFQLSWELRRLSKVEMEFAVEYKELRTQVQSFAVALLDHVRNTYELEICLNYDPSMKIKQELAEGEEQEMKLHRLKLAIDYKQKGFVAHPYVQQIMGTVWYQGMPGFRRKTMIGQGLKVLTIACCFPVYSLAAVICPSSKVGRRIRRPFIKFICHSTSYMSFVFLLALASQRVEWLLISWLFDKEDLPFWLYNAHYKARGKWPTITEWFIISYVCALVWQETELLFSMGLLKYIEDLWKVLDFMGNCVYVSWMALRLFSWFQVEVLEDSFKTANIPREYWHPYDPLLLSEGAFGFANVMSVMKLVHIFSVHPHLGPLQISLGRMVFDILKFFFLFILVVFAFGCGMNQLLWYYAKKDYDRCFGKEEGVNPLDLDHSCEVWRRFANLFETSQTLFWASFGLIDLKNFELTGIQEFTRFWGMLMYGSYSVINIVVLLNLLIAMMSNSYQIISERSDTEWKFARSKLWINYFNETATIPVPFNLIPPIGKLICTVKNKGGPITSSMRGSINRQSYENVMRCLVRRYVTREQRKAEQLGQVTEDDVNEIKQDIATFRYELLDLLHRNGMKGTQVAMDKDVASKKEKLRERRLLKGFNIGYIDQLKEGALTDKLTKQGSEEDGSLVRVASSFERHRKAKKRWTTAITTVVKQNGTQIGRSRNRSSLVDLRKSVLEEEEVVLTLDDEEEKKDDDENDEKKDENEKRNNSEMNDEMEKKRVESVKKSDSNQSKESEKQDTPNQEEKPKGGLLSSEHRNGNQTLKPDSNILSATTLESQSSSPRIRTGSSYGETKYSTKWF